VADNGCAADGSGDSVDTTLDQTGTDVHARDPGVVWHLTELHNFQPPTTACFEYWGQFSWNGAIPFSGVVGKSITGDDVAVGDGFTITKLTDQSVRIEYDGDPLAAVHATASCTAFKVGFLQYALPYLRLLGPKP
jgi:hypothetical protein